MPVYKGKREEIGLIILSFCCDPEGIQTLDLQNRNLTLYSAKLRDLCGVKQGLLNIV